jgi:two-component system cell cycle sensor histidine kinase/response regulator CckA
VRVTDLQQLEDRAAPDELARGVAHDLNNLVTVMLNCAASIARAEDADQAVRSDAGLIVEAAERAGRLTRRLLTDGALDAAAQASVDLNAVVGGILDLLTRLVGEGIGVVVAAAPALPRIHLDRDQVERVLMNLALNGRDAMREGGTLMIRTGVARLGESSPLLRTGMRPGLYVTLSVSDTGKGMSPDVAERAFAPYFTTKPDGQACGLGLAIVASIVLDLGGTVHLRSQPRLGTTVTAYLPAADVAR